MALDDLTNQERCLLVHVFSSLREHIKDELEFHNEHAPTHPAEPDFRGVLEDDERFSLLFEAVYGALETCMLEAQR